MAFHLGKPILVMIFCGIAAGVTSLATRHGDARPGYEVWCFSDADYKAATGIGRPAGTESLQQAAERELGHSVAIRPVQYRAMITRLSGLFMSGTRWPELPDLVTIEIGSVGQFFRPPVDQVGLLPLNDLIRRHGWSGKIVPARLATWSKHGTIFGIPQDVHPVALVYNDEMFREAGIDLAKSQTWADFTERCLQFQAYWRAHGQPRRWALELSESNALFLVTMLLQRGVNLVDDHDQIHLSDEKTLDTLVTYCKMMTGPRRIAASAAGGNEAFSQDLASGYVNVMICADWRIRYLKDNANDLTGKMRAMPLPAWPDSRCRTSTMGGSMIGIPRNARDPEGSWRLIEALYLNDRATAYRQGAGYVMPPTPAAWDTPLFDLPDEYFGGQPVKRLVAKLAPEVPPRYVSPTSAAAEVQLGLVMLQAIDYATSHSDQELRTRCRQLLSDATERLNREMEHVRFDP